MSPAMTLGLASLIMFAWAAGWLWLSPGPGWICKTVLSAILLLASLKYFIYQWAGGSFFAPRLPRVVLLGLEALYAALIILFLLLALRGLLGLALWLVHRAGLWSGFSLSAPWLWPALASLALGTASWGVWESVKVPEVRQRTVKIAALPEPLRGLRIVQLSDLHIGPILGRAWLEAVVSRVNAQKPDLIVLTGDYVDGHVAELARELEPLAELHAPLGVFAVTGNHEYYWGSEQWQKAISGLGLKFLENSHAALPVDGATLVLAGLPDAVAERFGLPGPNLEAALAGAPERAGSVRVLLAHQPRLASEYLKSVDLQLSGHTHGGHMFFLQPLIAAFNNGFVRGLYELGEGWLLLNPGTGLWGGFSCRVGVPSEISCITLEAAR